MTEKDVAASAVKEKVLTSKEVGAIDLALQKCISEMQAWMSIYGTDIDTQSIILDAQKARRFLNK